MRAPSSRMRIVCFVYPYSRARAMNSPRVGIWEKARATY